MSSKSSDAGLKLTHSFRPPSLVGRVAKRSSPGSPNGKYQIVYERALWVADGGPLFSCPSRVVFVCLSGLSCPVVSCLRGWRGKKRPDPFRRERKFTSARVQYFGPVRYLDFVIRCFFAPPQCCLARKFVGGRRTKMVQNFDPKERAFFQH